MDTTEYKTRYVIVTPDDLEEQRYQDELKRNNVKVDPRTIPSWKPNETSVADRSQILAESPVKLRKKKSSLSDDDDDDDDDEDIRKMKFRQRMEQAADIAKRMEKWNTSRSGSGRFGPGHFETNQGGSSRFVTGSLLAYKTPPMTPNKTSKNDTSAITPKQSMAKQMEEINNAFPKLSSPAISAVTKPEAKTPLKKKKTKVKLNESTSDFADFIPTDVDNKNKVSGEKGKTKNKDTTASGSKKCNNKNHFNNKHDKSKEGKRKCPLYKILNINPLDDGTEIDDVALNKVLDTNPELCQNFYRFDALCPPEDGDDSDNSRRSHLGEVVLLNKDWLHPLHMACCVGVSVATFKRMYKLHPGALEYTTEDNGYSVLHCACMYTRAPLRVVNQLIKLDESLLELACTAMNYTPLHLACSFSPSNDCYNSDFILLLTEKNKVPASMLDIDGKTPLHLACMVDLPCLAVVEDLTIVYPEACVVKSKDTGATPLHYACSNRDVHDKDSEAVDIIKELIRTDPSALRVKNKKGQIPIFCAVASGACVTVLKAIVKKYPESLTETNKRGQTPHKYAKYMKTLGKDAIEFLYPYEESEDESSTAPDTDED
jgi:Ankyrin repeat